MKTLVIGANGALGSDLMRVLAQAVPAVHQDFDICDYEKAKAFIEAAKVEAVVNTAAFHRVPDCETEYAKAFEVNVIGPRNLANICKELGIHLCHVSTDYVFDGKKRSPYTEEDIPAPLSIYAITKKAGEDAVAAYGENISIVRSCGLYGIVPTRAKGGNFINTMLKLGTTKELVTVVNDEWVCPTYTYDLAKGIQALLQAKGQGIFHITQAGETTWYDFTRVIFDEMQLPAKLEPTSASAFQSVVQRPAYSILSNARFEEVTGFKMPHWSDALKRHLQELKENQ